jgi:hypothetical protein
VWIFAGQQFGRRRICGTSEVVAAAKENRLICRESEKNVVEWPVNPILTA